MRTMHSAVAALALPTASVHGWAMPCSNLNRSLARPGLTKLAALSGPDSPPSAATVVATTRRWVKEVVVGLGLCPFAAKTMTSAGGLRFRVVEDADSWKSVVNAVQDEAKALLNAGSGTSLVVLSQPGAMADFHEFLTLHGALEQLFAETGLDKHLQIATFHPRYQFEGTEEDDASNLTNASPFPTLHLLLEDEVSAAVEAHGDTASIWQQNEDTMRSLGRARVLRLLTSLHSPDDAAAAR